MLRTTTLILAAATAATAMNCPKSDAIQHAGCQVTVSFTDSCADVQKEITTRINGQYDAWHDPHNNGTYTLTDTTATELSASRLTGDQKYTDKLLFTFIEGADGAGCKVEACSESQVFSIGDFSTNYCNLHSLYCADEGCRPFTTLTYTEAVGKCTASGDECLTV